MFMHRLEATLQEVTHQISELSQLYEFFSFYRHIMKEVF